MSRFVLALSVCAVSLGLSTSPALADAGSDAYRAGDYGRAIEAWRSQAYSDPYAAFNLGLMYETGRGTAENFRDAFKWYKEAASDARGEKYEKLKRAAAHALVRIVVKNEYTVGISTAAMYISTEAMKTGDPHSMRMRGLLMEYQADDSIARRIQNAQNPMEMAYGLLAVAAERGAPLAEAEAERVMSKVKDKADARREATRIKKQLKELGIE